MAKKKTRPRLPYWIRSQEFRLLNNSEKDFLGWLYSMGPDTCWLWNWRLEKKFHRCRRTIQYWLANLKDAGFIWIEKPYGPERKIHCRLLPTPDHWVKLIGTLALTRSMAKVKRPGRARRYPPRPIYKWSSKATIEQFRLDVINELVRRGESSETAAKVADGVIRKSQEKAGKKKV